jgi:hypothetical protein
LNIAVYQRLDYRVSQCSLGLHTLPLVVRLPPLGLTGLGTVASDLAPSTYKEIRPCFGAKAAGQQLGWHVLSGLEGLRGSMALFIASVSAPAPIFVREWFKNACTWYKISTVQNGSWS